MINSKPTDPSPRDIDALRAELKHASCRHAENLDGLRRTQANYQSEIARFDAEIANLTESLAHVAVDNWRNEVDAIYQIKRRIVELELNRDTLGHEGRLLEPQIAETVGLIEDNTAAIEALKGEAGLSPRHTHQESPCWNAAGESSARLPPNSRPETSTVWSSRCRAGPAWSTSHTTWVPTPKSSAAARSPRP